ncbi:MAG: hypothetical protein KJ070_25445 [Verrucomicrobia bacterium]|nr:hypothetical protein [Verrucomicrobiota bacterium]
MSAEKSNLTRDEMLAAFQAMSDELGRRNVKGELCLLGGAAMVLAYAARLSTKDVDAIFEPTRVIREVARQVGEAQGFTASWLNDAAKGYASTRHEAVAGNLPQFPNLRLLMPTPEYLLAMKCMASRIGAVESDADDVNDIVFLIRHLRLKNADAVMEVVSAYYPVGRVPIKSQYLVEGLFAEGKI